MQKSKCTHIRIRDDNDYNLDIEAFIKHLERKLNIDIRSLPQWPELVKRLHVTQTDCKRRIQHANLQKAIIIKKLYIESTRPSPFQLTTELARTASTWRRLERERRKPDEKPTWDIPEPCLEVPPDEILEEEVGEELDTLHPNTENLSDTSRIIAEPEPSKLDAGVQYSTEHFTELNTLPVVISTNAHKLISPMGSKMSPLSCVTITDHMGIAEEAEITEWQPSSSVIVCNPSRLEVGHDTLEQQSLLFLLTNRTGVSLYIRFKYVTDNSPFKKTKLVPVIPKRLYPGIAVAYKFIFKLKSLEAFKTSLYFKIGHDVYTDVPSEQLFVPIASAFGIKRVVKISDTVTIPPVYSWHIKMGPECDYPSGILKIFVDDPYSYHLHIHKRFVDLSSESLLSIKPSPPSVESMEQRGNFIPSESFVQSNVLVNTKSSDKTSKDYHKDAPATEQVKSEIEQINIIDVMTSIIEDIVQFALDVFVFDSTYLYLSAHSKTRIPVYFTKAEHIGYHNSYYDLDLIDPETETVVETKTIKVFAEVLPHPIQITPLILDMSNSPVSHGYHEDCFIVNNNHRLFPVTVHIKLTTKMKKIFYVVPMTSVVPAQSRVTFEVKFCSRDYLSPTPFEDLAHFTFKIVVVGYKTVYENIPPIFYEIIAPCATEFKKLYNERYFKETE